LSFGFTDVVPGTIGNGIRGMFFMNTSPPKPYDDRINFFYKALEKRTMDI
jgi:hypothetical protein